MIANRFQSLVARQGLALSRPAQNLVARRAYSSATSNEFTAERQHVKEHAAKSADLWRKVSMYVCIPGSLVLAVYIYGIEAEHHQHALHEFHEAGDQAPERIRYEYSTIRRKGFPWGDGSKTLFHNDMVNTAASP